MNINDIIKSVKGYFPKVIIYSQMYVNDFPTQVEIKYSPEFMEIRNLEELPDMRFDMETLNGTTTRILVSGDGETWNVLEDSEMEQDLQIYRLLHPLFVLPHLEFEVSEIVDVTELNVEATYTLESMPFPPSVKEFFSQNNEKRRRLRLTLVPGWGYPTYIAQITQRDFPPFRDTITIRFNPPTRVGI